MSQGLADPHKFSRVSGARELSLIDCTIGMALDQAAEKYGSRAALTVCHQQISLSYRQLKSQADAFANGLLALGLVPGDRIGIWAPTRAEWTVTQYAAAKLGLILVNLNPAYRLAEIEYALNSVECRALVVSDRFKTSDYIEMMYALAPELASCAAGELRSPRLPKLEIVIKLGKVGRSGFLTFAEVASRGATGDVRRLNEISSSLRASDPINIQFTSGTTGAPKGATLNHKGLLNNAYFTGVASLIGPSDVICVPLPLYHVFGMASGNLLAMLHGAKIVYPSEGFEPAAVLTAIEAQKCTSLYGVPTMFVGLLAHSEAQNYDLSSLGKGIIAGASVPAELMRRVISELHMDQVVIGYGMTETSAAIMMTSSEDSIERRVSTVGRVLPHTEVQIVDRQSKVVPRGEIGEICVRGYSVMMGYWKDPEKTAEVIDADEWLHTGDLGTIDENGYGKIVGRLKELVIRGGENISPAEIEAFLHTHEKIELAQVVGVPDNKYGEELCACIKIKAGQQLSTDDVRAFCNGRIAHYKIPRYVVFVDQFPMTSSGKIQKFILAQDMARQLSLQN
ncbi:AMP-binding protein [Bradyrhizobium manausense]|uniref:AMP-binding protein n=1 Tax=Bradyrhizobium manausense TaxID=989370 RepID=UPI0032DEE7D8